MRKTELYKLRDKLGSIGLRELWEQKQHGGDRRSKKFQEIKKFQERKFAHLKIRRDELIALIIDSSHSARTFQKIRKIAKIGKYNEEAMELIKRIDSEGLSVDSVYKEAMRIETRVAIRMLQEETMKEASKNGS